MARNGHAFSESSRAGRRPAWRSGGSGVPAAGLLRALRTLAMTLALSSCKTFYSNPLLAACATAAAREGSPVLVRMFPT